MDHAARIVHFGNQQFQSLKRAPIWIRFADVRGLQFVDVKPMTTSHDVKAIESVLDQERLNIGVNLFGLIVKVHGSRIHHQLRDERFQFARLACRARPFAAVIGDEAGDL